MFVNSDLIVYLSTLTINSFCIANILLRYKKHIFLFNRWRSIWWILLSTMLHPCHASMALHPRTRKCTHRMLRGRLRGKWMGVRREGQGASCSLPGPVITSWMLPIHVFVQQKSIFLSQWNLYFKNFHGYNQQILLVLWRSLLPSLTVINSLLVLYHVNRNNNKTIKLLSVPRKI